MDVHVHEAFSALTLTNQGGLGNLRKLPPELRIMIWKELFRDIEQLQGPRSDSTSSTNESVISVMGCSKQLYEEVSELLFNNFSHEIEVSSTSDGPGWFINISARYLNKIRWAVPNEQSLVKHVVSFPHDKTERAKRYKIESINVRMNAIESPQPGQHWLPFGEAWFRACKRLLAVHDAYKKIPDAQEMELNVSIKRE
ncbi:hypothetical protein N7466_010526 [Penicillium verhagenii]|uniref:uncharacterized protein n=1 Tax=Penicillium verhagenii TaxID=1562060 RepID=UPI0025458642|nr:uncharacterized protein N7466_010526 [Penicillium verhagenii]KAJ5918534.1 hypothetical protein N7466_010526 [Penicillium verhagenii]